MPNMQIKNEIEKLSFMIGTLAQFPKFSYYALKSTTYRCSQTSGIKSAANCGNPIKLRQLSYAVDNKAKNKNCSAFDKLNKKACKFNANILIKTEIQNIPSPHSYFFERQKHRAEANAAGEENAKANRLHSGVRRVVAGGCRICRCAHHRCCGCAHHRCCFCCTHGALARASSTRICLKVEKSDV